MYFLFKGDKTLIRFHALMPAIFDSRTQHNYNDFQIFRPSKGKKKRNEGKNLSSNK